ncbi:hypothetical protein [Streptosporangium sp. NPDC051022]|uniref:hypothetical protein n=1 Tax=Streptosporangium sp. NPDC051022 TaxID=3155752 RepID=UPI00343F8002
MSDFEKRESGFEFIGEDAILTPVQTDYYLKVLNNELGRSQLAVKRARQDELEKERSYLEMRAPLLLDEDCPEVGRGAGQVSAKERDSWFAARIPDEYWAYREAKVVRTNAVDYAWQVKAQVEIMRSLNVNAKAIYDSHGGGR